MYRTISIHEIQGLLKWEGSEGCWINWPLGGSSQINSPLVCWDTVNFLKTSHPRGNALENCPGKALPHHLCISYLEAASSAQWLCPGVLALEKKKTKQKWWYQRSLHGIWVGRVTSPKWQAHPEPYGLPDNDGPTGMENLTGSPRPETLPVCCQIKGTALL